MVRPRAYRHDVRCTDCGSNWMAKAGHSKGRQRFKCDDCRRSYLPEGDYRRSGPAVKAGGVRRGDQREDCWIWTAPDGL